MVLRGFMPFPWAMAIRSTMYSSSAPTAATRDMQRMPTPSAAKIRASSQAFGPTPFMTKPPARARNENASVTTATMKAAHTPRYAVFRALFSSWIPR